MELYKVSNWILNLLFMATVYQFRKIQPGIWIPKFCYFTLFIHSTKSSTDTPWKLVILPREISQNILANTTIQWLIRTTQRNKRRNVTVEPKQTAHYVESARKARLYTRQMSEQTPPQWNTLDRQGWNLKTDSIATSTALKTEMQTAPHCQLMYGNWKTLKKNMKSCGVS